MANQPKVRKIPMRRCVGCGEHFPKSALIRVVRSPEGVFSLDLTGRAAGRGAYMCGSEQCMKKLSEKKLLNKAFSTAVDATVYAGVEEEANGNE